MVGRHDQLRHEFEQAPGVDDGQGSLACCSWWGHKEFEMTKQLNWTDVHWVGDAIQLSHPVTPFPASGSFPVNWLFTSGGQSIGASASGSVFSMNIQGWYPCSPRDSQGSFPVTWLFISGGQSIGASASGSVLPMNIQGWFLLGWLVWYHCCPSKSQESSPVTELESINFLVFFFMVQLSHLYMTTGKSITLTTWTFISKVMSAF